MAKDRHFEQSRIEDGESEAVLYRRRTGEEQRFQSLLKQSIREVLAEQPTEERKTIYKEAIQEWLDEKYATFGRWSLGGIAAAALALLGYFLAVKSGWIPPH